MSASAGCGVTPEDSGRALVWEDDFDGPAGSFPDAASWSPETGGGGWGNEELQTYTSEPANVGLDGAGNLVITARAQGEGAQTRWTSARITTFGKRTFQFGRVEVRAHVPSGAGIWPAAWTLGRNIQDVGWPRSGEIDVIESIGDARTALQTLHGPRGDGGHWYETTSTPVDRPLSAGFHTYSAEWTAEGITFGIDDRTTGTLTPADVPEGGTWPFTAPQYLLLNVAVGGRLPGPPDATTPRRAPMLVDWVRVYAPA
ncbi:glycoside hydrolase family 16 protein [Modestobacter sp. SSW1-42]|uniref:glycoside hydrolase family 16 protein n=1 Tax=Modestobacter sp. SSW1-42 TaxID=596372 RepID=UPI003986772E